MVEFTTGEITSIDLLTVKFVILTIYFYEFRMSSTENLNHNLNSVFYTTCKFASKDRL